jgi:hypothetical protein
MRRASAESQARTAALIALGAFAVHQLRFLAGYGQAAGSELAHQGHGYMQGALPVLAAFAAAAIAAGFLRAALGRSRAAERRGCPGAADTLVRRSVCFSVAIAAIYCGQEALEGMLAAGHPGGVAAVLGSGGWLALPLAVVVGALCALLDRGVVVLERAIAVAAVVRGPARRPLDPPRPRSRGAVPLAAAPLSFGIARRPPPALA